MPLAITFSDTEKMTGITLHPTKSNGSPTTIDGLPTATVTVGDCTTLVNADGTVDVISGTPGNAEVLVEADADLGTGVVTISDVITVTIVGSLATSLGLAPGQVVPK